MGDDGGMEGELGGLLCADLRVNTRTVQILLVGGGGGGDWTVVRWTSTNYTGGSEQLSGETNRCTK